MKTFLIVIAVVVGIVLGFALGRLSHGDREAVMAASTASPESAPTSEVATTSSKGDADCQHALVRAQAQVQSWEAKAKVQGWILGNVQDALSEYEKSDSDPVIWDEEAPASFRPEAFERVITTAVDQAKAGIEYVGVSCNEAPCVALLRLGEGDSSDDSWLRKLQATAAWSESYDNQTGLWQTVVDCKNGRKERIALVAKRWLDMPDALKLHMEKRLIVREQAIIDGWTCRADVPR